MSKSLKYEEVKQLVENRKYTLLTLENDYNNESQLLKIQCLNKDHPYMISSINNFHYNYVSCEYCLSNIDNGAEICRYIFQTVYSHACCDRETVHATIKCFIGPTSRCFAS